MIVECGVEQEEQLVGCVAYLIAVTTLDQHLVCEPAHLPTAWLLSGLLLFNKECCDGLTSNIDGILAKYTVQLNAYDWTDWTVVVFGLSSVRNSVVCQARPPRWP